MKYRKIDKNKYRHHRWKGKFLIEKKISENTYQNQTQIDTGEGIGENWPLKKIGHTRVRVNLS